MKQCLETYLENTYFYKKMCTDSLIILCVWKSSYELNSRVKQSKYCLRNSVFLQNDAHEFTDYFVRSEKFIRVELEG